MSHNSNGPRAAQTVRMIKKLSRNLDAKPRLGFLFSVAADAVLLDEWQRHFAKTVAKAAGAASFGTPFTIAESIKPVSAGNHPWSIVIQHTKSARK